MKKISNETEGLLMSKILQKIAHEYKYEKTDLPILYKNKLRNLS